jgi:hypothetical protein
MAPPGDVLLAARVEGTHHVVGRTGERSTVE